MAMEKFGIQNLIKRWLKDLENFLFAPTCVVTNQPTEQIDLQPGLVASWSLGVYLCPKCNRLGLSNQVCAKCLQAPGLVEKSLVAFAFKDDLRELIHQYKYQKQLYLSRLLAEAWLQEMNFREPNFQQQLRQPAGQIDALIPIPLHKSRLRERGYNQALELAKNLAEHLQIPVLNCLVRSKKTPSQTGLKASERRQNLKDAFAIAPEFLPQLQNCRRIALVDDVITTGSTMHFAITCLQTVKPGLVVQAFAIART